MQAERNRRLLQNSVPHESQTSGAAKADQTPGFADRCEIAFVPLLGFIARIRPWPIWWGTGQELMAGPKRGRSLARDDTEPGDRSRNVVSSAL